MPAKNPRLTITIEPQLAAQLRRLSELTGNSQSALISELLEGSSVIFSRLIKVLEAARDARAAVRGSIAHDLEHVQGKLEHRLGLTLEMADELVEREETNEVKEILRRARRGAGSPPAPRRGKTPVSNRGVRSTKTKDKAKPRVRQNQGFSRWAPLPILGVA
jgi:hypothetical protein